MEQQEGGKEGSVKKKEEEEKKRNEKLDKRVCIWYLRFLSMLEW